MFDRDENGRFVKGCHLFGKGKGIKNGRKKTIGGQVKDALRIAEDAMPAIIADMIVRATDPDISAAVRQAAGEYLCDRIYGRPNQPLSNAGKAPLTSFVFQLPDGTMKTAKELLNDNSH